MDVQLLLVFPAKTAGSKRALLAVVGAKLTLLKALHGYCPSWVCRQLLLRGSRCCEQTMPRVASTDTTAAPSLRAAPLRRNKPDSTSGGPLCFQQGCMHAARGMSICRWPALSHPFPSPAAPSRLVRLLFWHRKPRGSGAFGLLRPSPPERRAHLGRTSWCRGRLRLRIEPAQADPTAPPASQRAARASWPAGAGWK